jgi:hypothetical protein
MLRPAVPPAQNVYHEEPSFWTATDIGALMGKARECLATSGGAPGSDGVTKKMFKRRLGDFVTLAHLELRNGCFAPKPIRKVEVPKKTGDGVRPLGMRPQIDRVVGASVLEQLDRVLEPALADGQLAYRKGLGSPIARRAAALLAMDHSFAVKLDLRKAFDNVPLVPAFENLKPLVADPWLLYTAWQFISTPAEGETTQRQVGLWQGCALSGALLNLYLADWVRAQWAAGRPTLTYADDLVVFFNVEHEAQRFIDEVIEQGVVGLEVNLSKSMLVNVETGWLPFCGYWFAPDVARPSDERLTKIIADVQEERTLRGKCDLLTSHIHELDIGDLEPFWAEVRAQLSADDAAILDHTLERVTVKRAGRTHQERSQQRWELAASLLTEVAAVRTRPEYDSWDDDLYADLSAQMEAVA